MIYKAPCSEEEFNKAIARLRNEETVSLARLLFDQEMGNFTLTKSCPNPYQDLVDNGLEMGLFEKVRAFPEPTFRVASHHPLFQPRYSGEKNVRPRQ